jgi:hypothetical protein
VCDAWAALTYLFVTVRPAGWTLKAGAAARRRPSWKTRWEAIFAIDLVVVEGSNVDVLVLLHVSMSSSILAPNPEVIPVPNQRPPLTQPQHGRQVRTSRKIFARVRDLSSSRTSLSPTLSASAEGVGVTSHLLSAVMVGGWDRSVRRETPVVNHSY